MKKAFFTLFMAVAALQVAAQEARPFDTTIHNEEYKIYIKMDLYDKDITVPGQDVLGEMDGYFGSTQSRSMWMIVSSRLIDERTAEIEVANDYGSEDFIAVLKVERRHVLVQEEGRQHAEVRRKRQVAEAARQPGVQEEVKNSPSPTLPREGA